MRDNQCAKEEEHKGHTWITTLSKMCSGQAECGDMSHPPHQFRKTVTKWCPGICLCGIIKTTHGLGDHK